MNDKRFLLFAPAAPCTDLKRLKQRAPLRYVPLFTLFFIGCGLFNEDEIPADPQFLYSCVNPKADYACLNPQNFNFSSYMGNGYVLDSMALGSQFHINYGRPSLSQDGGDDGHWENNYPEVEGTVLSASTERVSSGTAFTARVTGPTALIAINESNEAIDYMYVSVEAVTDIEFPSSSINGREIEITLGKSLTLHGIPVNNGMPLRGTLSFECNVEDSQNESSTPPVQVNCSSPGAIELTPLSVGKTTLEVKFAQQAVDFTVNVLPNNEDTDTDTETETETETETNIDTIDAGTDVDSGTDTESDTDADTDSDTHWDAGPIDAGPLDDAGVFDDAGTSNESGDQPGSKESSDNRPMWSNNA